MFLRDNLNFKLRSLASIYRWFPPQEIHVGSNKDDLFSEIQSRIDHFTNESKQVMLCFDEMHIARKVEYNSKHDRIEGFEDYGDGKVANLER